MITAPGELRERPQLLKQLTKTVLETALNQELTEHLGHEKHGRPDPVGSITGSDVDGLPGWDHR